MNLRGVARSHPIAGAVVRIAIVLSPASCRSLLAGDGLKWHRRPACENHPSDRFDFMGETPKPPQASPASGLLQPAAAFSFAGLAMT